MDSAIDERAIEEVDREAVVLIDLLAVCGATTVVGVADVPDRVDELPARTQKAVNLGHQLLELPSSESHAEQHVRIHGVHGEAAEWQRRAHVVDQLLTCFRSSGPAACSSCSSASAAKSSAVTDRPASSRPMVSRPCPAPSSSTSRAPASANSLAA